MIQGSFWDESENCNFSYPFDVHRFTSHVWQVYNLLLMSLKVSKFIIFSPNFVVCYCDFYVIFVIILIYERI